MDSDLQAIQEVEAMIEKGLVERNFDGSLSWTTEGKKCLESLADTMPELYVEIFKERFH
jgi:hypothetical protein